MTEPAHTKAFRMFTESIEDEVFHIGEFNRPQFDTDPLRRQFSSTRIEDTMSSIEFVLRLRDPSDATYKRYRWLCELIITRVIGAFDYYISLLLRDMFVYKPEQLIGSQIDMREVLDASTISELIQRFADKKVYDPGYKGLDELAGYLDEKLGIHINRDTPTFRNAQKFALVRNLIVHNAGRVDKQYLNRVSQKSLKDQTPLKIGDLYPFTDGTYIRDGIDALRKVAEEIDKEVVTKFPPLAIDGEEPDQEDRGFC
jgi:hypothetical protein